MRSLEAIRVDPFLRNLPRQQIVIVGSVTLALYKDMAGIDKAERYLRIDDLDLCIEGANYNSLFRRSKPKGRTSVRRPWAQNAYRGVETLRREHRVNGLKRPVQLDVGSSVFTWSHDQLLPDALEYNDYSVLSPFRQLAWYGALGRKKDDIKIEMLRELIIPTLADSPDLTLPVPVELQCLAQDVLGRAA